jgi:hypothetical protein
LYLLTIQGCWLSPPQLISLPQTHHLPHHVIKDQLSLRLSQINPGKQEKLEENVQESDKRKSNPLQRVL